jgi:hypothetical protein
MEASARLGRRRVEPGPVVFPDGGYSLGAVDAGPRWYGPDPAGSIGGGRDQRERSVVVDADRRASRPCPGRDLVTVNPSNALVNSLKAVVVLAGHLSAES